MKMENKQELPVGWKWVKLGEVCQFEYGTGLPERDRINGSVPVFGSNGIVGYHSVSITKGPTIIVGRKGSIGQVNYSIESCWPIDTTYYIDSSKTNCELIWLYWLLKWLRLDLLNKATGVPGLNREDAYSQLVPLPPLSEQKRIAEKLKAMMDEIDEAKASIEKQLEAAKALPSAYLSEVFESPEAQKWEKKKLGEVCEIIKGKKPILYDENASNKALPYLTAEVIRYNLKPKWCLESNGDVVRVNKDEIVIIADGSNSGEVFIGFEGALASTMGKLKIINENVSTDFLYLFIKKNFKELNAPKRGSAIPHLEKDIFYNLSIPLPPLSEQKRIASYLKEKIDQAEKSRETLEKELETLNALPQSILSKAFRGEI